MLELEIREDEFMSNLSSTTMTEFINIFAEIEDHKGMLRQYEVEFEKEFVPINYKIELKSASQNFKNLDVKFKQAVQAYIIASRSSRNGAVSNTEVNEVGNQIQLEISSLSFPDFNYKKMTYHTIKAAGLLYVGRDYQLDSIIRTQKHICVLLLPDGVGGKGNEEFNERFLEYTAAYNGSGIAVDCEFGHYICKNRNFTSGLVLEILNGRVLNSNETMNSCNSLSSAEPENSKQRTVISLSPPAFIRRINSQMQELKDRVSNVVSINFFPVADW